MSLDRFQQKREDRSALLRAGGDGGPDALAPPAAGFAARALRDAAVRCRPRRRTPLRRGMVPIEVHAFGKCAAVLGFQATAATRHQEQVCLQTRDEGSLCRPPHKPRDSFSDGDACPPSGCGEALAGRG